MSERVEHDVDMADAEDAQRDTEYDRVKSSMRPMRLGEEWCLIDRRWFQTWERATKLDPDEQKPRDDPKSILGPIDNSDLFADNWLELKPGLEEYDYKFVPRKTWDFLVNKYGGDDSSRISRYIVSVGEGSVAETIIDLRPMYLKLGRVVNGVVDTSDPVTEYISRYGTLMDFLLRLHKERGLPVEEGEDPDLSLRLWRKVDKSIEMEEGPSAISTMVEDVATFTWIDSDEMDSKASDGEKMEIDFDRLEEKEEVVVLESKGGNVDEWELIEHKDLMKKLENIPLGELSGLLSVTKFLVEEKDPDRGWLKEWIPHWRRFKVGQYVDILDKNDKWYTCRVEYVKEEHIYVHYEGCAPRWDEWVRRDDLDRMAEVHTFTPKRIEQEYNTNYNSSFMNKPGVKGKPEAAGAVGLVNLGNTCYMASTVQCLAQTGSVLDYFLQDKFKEDINQDNPLGFKGVVAENWSKLLHMLWDAEWTTVSPTDWKSTIAKVQPQFAGWAQHDAQELLTFVLDGLHEDLNRVQKKPVVETVESNNRDDHLVAKESWDGYQLRNRSVIVDTFTGQLKSRVECPDCGKISVTFDPFNVLTVPISAKMTRLLRVSIQWLSPEKIPITIGMEISKHGNIMELKQMINDKYGIKFNEMEVVRVTNSVVTEIYNSHQIRNIPNDADIWVYELESQKSLRWRYPEAKEAEFSSYQIIPRDYGGEGLDWEHYNARPLNVQLPVGKFNPSFILEIVEDKLKPYLNIEEKQDTPHTLAEEDPYDGYEMVPGVVAPEAGASDIREKVDEKEERDSEEGEQKPSAPSSAILVSIDESNKMDEDEEKKGEPEAGVNGGVELSDAAPARAGRFPFLTMYTIKYSDNNLVDFPQKDATEFETKRFLNSRVSFVVKFDKENEKYFNKQKFQQVEVHPSAPVLSLGDEKKEEEEHTLEKCLEPFCSQGDVERDERLVL